MGLAAVNLKWLTQQLPEKNANAAIYTIGRQTSYLTDQEIDQHLKHVGGEFKASKPEWGKDSVEDILLHTFGGKEVTSVDVCDYEGATVCADMNYPIDKSMHQSADILIDGGSLEHVFNVSQCLYNYMNLTKVGGSLSIFTTANNHCGHGFYQLSPELFFSLFTEERGFSLKSVVFMMHPYPGAEYGNPRCYEVCSPLLVKRRVGLISRKPVLIMVHAKKTRHVELESVPYPIQSDYVNLHADTNGKVDFGSVVVRSAKKILRRFPKSVTDHLIGFKAKRNYSVANKRFYKRWKSPY